MFVVGWRHAIRSEWPVIPLVVVVAVVVVVVSIITVCQTVYGRVRPCVAVYG